MRGLAYVLFASLLLVPPAAAAEKPLAPYNALIIQKFTVDPDVLRQSDFPGGYEDVIEKTLMARLLTEKVFPEVIEGSNGSMVVSLMGRTIILDGRVTAFSKGNRAARVTVGYGVGSAKMTLILVFSDMETKREVLRLEQTGRYAGFGNLTGGSVEKARSESARKLVNGLLKKIAAAR